jgi:ABC-type multidrug transport system fused ATPase/permease subunit
VRNFRRLLAPLLPHRVAVRLRWTVLGAVVLAALDALGVLLILPLVQMATTLDQAGKLPFPANRIADLLDTTDRGRVALVLAVVVVVAFVVKGVAALLLLRFTTRTCLDAEADMAGRLVNAYLNAPFTFHLRHNSAELQTTVHDSLRHVYQDGLAFSIPATADRYVVAAIGASLFVVAPVDTIVGGLALAVVAVAYRRSANRRVLASSAEMLDQIRRSYQLTQQALTSIREITVSGTASRFADRILLLRQGFAKRQAILSLTEQLPRYYLEIGLVFGAAAVACVSFLLRPASDALAVLGLIMVGGLRVLPSVNRMVNASAKAHAALPYVMQLKNELDEATTGAVPTVDSDPLDPDRRVDLIRFDAVDFSYDTGARVLRSVTLEIRAGEMIAVVGSSGAGKTTFVSLLLGLLDPTEGAILIGGRELSTCRRSWQHRVGYVPQDVVVFDASVRDNVAFAEDAPDDERVWQALTAAQLDDVVRAMPLGLEGVVGEGGSRISGGQRQRLGLARAFYRGPELLVLDEATSSLDTETEARVLDTLDGVRGSTTIVVVAHRLSTVRNCDRIVVLADGSVETIGTYDELLTSSPTFRSLVTAAVRERTAG